MLQLFAFRRSLRALALALCSVSFAVAATPASARPHHGRHARGYHAGHHARHYAHRHVRQIRAFSSEVDTGSRQENASNKKSRASRWERGVAQMQAGGFADTNAALPDYNNSTLTPPGGVAAPASFGSSNVVAEARRYLGGNPTGRGPSRRWRRPAGRRRAGRSSRTILPCQSRCRDSRNAATPCS